MQIDDTRREAVVIGTLDAADDIGSEVDILRAAYGEERNGQQPLKIDLTHSTTEGDLNKLELLLKNITTHGIEQLREVRDGASAAMQAIHEAHQELVDGINEHTQRIERAIKTKIVVTPALAEIKRDFTNGKG